MGGRPKIQKGPYVWNIYNLHLPVYNCLDSSPMEHLSNIQAIHFRSFFAGRLPLRLHISSLATGLLVSVNFKGRMLEGYREEKQITSPQPTWRIIPGIVSG